MDKFSINAFAFAAGLAFSAGAMAQSMAKDDYKAGKAKDHCLAQAKKNFGKS